MKVRDPDGILLGAVPDLPAAINPQTLDAYQGHPVRQFQLHGRPAERCVVTPSLVVACAIPGFVENRPPRSVAELLALPEGPGAVAAVLHPITPQERANGFATIQGRKVQVSRVTPGKFIMVPVSDGTEATFAAETDIVAATDAEGRSWTAGRYPDGEYFRRRLSTLHLP